MWREEGGGNGREVICQPAGVPWLASQPDGEVDWNAWVSAGSPVCSRNGVALALKRRRTLLLGCCVSCRAERQEGGCDSWQGYELEPSLQRLTCFHSSNCRWLGNAPAKRPE